MCIEKFPRLPHIVHSDGLSLSTSLFRVWCRERSDEKLSKLVLFQDVGTQLFATSTAGYGFTLRSPLLTCKQIQRTCVWGSEFKAGFYDVISINGTILPSRSWIFGRERRSAILEGVMWRARVTGDRRQVRVVWEISDWSLCSKRERGHDARLKPTGRKAASDDAGLTKRANGQDPSLWRTCVFMRARFLHRNDWRKKNVA